MERTIEIDGKPVRLSNNISWAMIYRDQFGTDIVATLMPLLGATLNVLGGIADSIEGGEVTAREVLRLAESGALTDALVQASLFELNDLIRIVWSMAKCADETIPEPARWVRQFDTFELDVIVPVAADMIVKGVISSKNLERLQTTIGRLKPEGSN